MQKAVIILFVRLLSVPLDQTINVKKINFANILKNSKNRLKSNTKE
jgi:hypothetical protein